MLMLEQAILGHFLAVAFFAGERLALAGEALLLLALEAVADLRAGDAARVVARRADGFLAFAAGRAERRVVLALAVGFFVL